MATRSSTTTSALRLQQRRHGLVCPNCWTKHSSKQESLPFIAAFCAWIASQDIDNRSRGAAIDPESFRDSAYAPRHPIDLAPQHELALALEPFSDFRMDVESAPGDV